MEPPLLVVCQRKVADPPLDMLAVMKPQHVWAEPSYVALPPTATAHWAFWELPPAEQMMDADVAPAPLSEPMRASHKIRYNPADGAVRLPKDWLLVRLEPVRFPDR